MYKTCTVRSTESIDRLIRISNHKKLSSPGTPQLYQPVLNRIDILKFIYQQIPERLLPAFLYLPIFDSFRCPQQKVIKIQCPKLLLFLFIKKECCLKLLCLFNHLRFFCPHIHTGFPPGYPLQKFSCLHIPATLTNCLFCKLLLLRRSY